MANQIMSQREQYFEDPDKYRPERWLNKDEHAHNPYQEYLHLPFGYGARSCLGRDMAETQMMLLTTKVNEFYTQRNVHKRYKIYILQLVQEFAIEYDYGDLRSQFLMVNVPNKPLRFRFIDRN